MERNKKQNHRKALIQKYGNICSICGRKVPEEMLVIDHIYPLNFGGSDDIDNLQLTCRNCNTIKGNSPFFISEYQFVEFIQQLLEKHPRYSNIKSPFRLKDSGVFVDLAFDRATDNIIQTIIAEINISTAFTEKRIDDIIGRFCRLRDLHLKDNFVFAFPGKLPQNYIDKFSSHNIEIWDSSFISQEFREQIKFIEDTKFSSIIGILQNQSDEVNEIQKFITKLNNCEAGTAHWGEYQKLVGEILDILFCPPLKHPISQSNDGTKKNRRDFVLPNCVLDKNVWKFLQDKYFADYIVVDAKNSKSKVTKQDILQMAHYLKREGAGLFGIIVSRSGISDAGYYSLKDVWVYEHKMIVVLDDNDIEQMLIEKEKGNEPAELLLKKIEDFRLLI